MTDRVTTPFGFSTTAAEVLAGLDLEAMRVLVTGGASGIGAETARALAAAGAEVWLAVRDVEAGQRVAEQIAAGLPGERALGVAPLDLADQASVAACVEGWEGPLDVLVANAGVMACPQESTPEGWELQLATNHLGHLALAHGLHDALVEAALEGGRPARIVVVSSSAHLLSPLVFDDLHFRFRPYDPWLAYGQSKTAGALFAVGATARWGDDGIVANALMPGAIATRLQRHSGGLQTAEELRKTPEQGAATSVLLAASPLVEGVGGRYFADGNEAVSVTHRPDDAQTALTAVAPYALDAANADRLWDLSLRTLGLH